MKYKLLSPIMLVNGDSTLEIQYPSVNSVGVEVSSITIGEYKWVYLPLPIDKGDVIKEIILNYRVTDVSSYISQVRLIEQENPENAIVIHDDGTNLNSPIFSTYTSKVLDVIANNSILLMFRLNFSNINHKIKFGGIQIGYLNLSESKQTGIFNVKDFGANGDGIIDDSAAFERALGAIDEYANSFPDHYGYLNKRGAILFVPAGHYRLTKTLILKRSVTLQGSGKIHTCNLDFELPLDDSPFSGIIVEGAATLIKDIAIITPNRFGRNMDIINDEDNFEGLGRNLVSSGIVVRGNSVCIENCYIAGFDHDGIHINRSHVGDNMNTWRIINCTVAGNGRHGLFFAGNDVNAGTAIGVSAMSNRRYGYYDITLGNCFVGCHAEGNIVGAFCIKSARNSVVIGAYPDSGEKIFLNYPNILIGGSFDNEQIVRLPSADPNPLILINDGKFDVNAIKETGTVRRYIRHIPEYANNSKIFNYYNVLLVDASSGFLDLVLPSSGGMADEKANHGFQVTIKKIDNTNNFVKISPPVGSPDKIENTSEIILNQPFSWITLVFEQYNVATTVLTNKWYIIGRG